MEDGEKQAGVFQSFSPGVGCERNHDRFPKWATDLDRRFYFWQPLLSAMVPIKACERGSFGKHVLVAGIRAWGNVSSNLSGVLEDSNSP